MRGAARLAAAVLGLYLCGSGLRALAEHRWFYPDGLGLAVPAPLALLVGAILLALALRRGSAAGSP